MKTYVSTSIRKLFKIIRFKFLKKYLDLSKHLQGFNRGTILKMFYLINNFYVKNCIFLFLVVFKITLIKVLRSIHQSGIEKSKSVSKLLSDLAFQSTFKIRLWFSIKKY